ncbi:MAG: LysM peptidoglycan-binding domain-containing protein [Anaerolineaceae bacterium]|nr:LysM peptidoglycan-binding domain-containing protein [Anaerolineaceae bacterium]MCY4024625.1 LysM peptidoglycan-binding domain-containing protein [Anaerolineaceae bacterium]
MRSAGLRLAGCIGLALVTLLAGCYQSANEPAQQDSQLPSGVATFTPSAANVPITAVAAVDPGPSETPAPVQPPLQNIDPLNLTATAIIARATQTQAAIDAGGQAPGEPAPVVTPAVPPATVEGAEGAGPQGDDCIHVVQASDVGLSYIATLYGVTVAEIQQVNNLANVELIHIGNELVIPGCGSTGYQQGEAPGEGCTPAEYRLVHTVRTGENLFRIALNYGLDVDQLAQANCIPDPALIRVGQQIYIP